MSTVTLHGVRIVSLFMDGKERLCLAQISNTLLKDYSYNEIHNRRVALGITCVQCTPVQVSIQNAKKKMGFSTIFLFSWKFYGEPEQCRFLLGDAE